VLDSVAPARRQVPPPSRNAKACLLASSRRDKIRETRDETDSEDEDSTSYNISYPSCPTSDDDFDRPIPSLYKVERIEKNRFNNHRRKSLTTRKVILMFPTFRKNLLRSSGASFKTEDEESEGDKKSKKEY
jgi:hypothetical protein